ncbi:acetyltransferase, partial [Streptomyces sp. NPDC051051]|uniref:acetyltransferase n=1 Tax=Streptomyces sp. NPDC051051 TaxID=3155666 RepID=UPI003425DBF6
ARWMNDPEVAAFWELAGPDTVTAAHLHRQLPGPRSTRLRPPNARIALLLRSRTRYATRPKRPKAKQQAPAGPTARATPADPLHTAGTPQPHRPSTSVTWMEQ